MSSTSSSYAEIIAEAESGIKGGNQFLDFIRLDIDIRNIKTLFRLRADAFEEDAREMYIPGRRLFGCGFCKPECHSGPERVHRSAQDKDPPEVIVNSPR